ncbi:uncharacterized protein LOC121377857 [Gigantopelta aegis]|uniref:uncharacterized protein LOC121377857 n=1 Tax=Gigantopelta aegis TaxID=1735272 RepID=UPI001B88D032|nr:uncharacterized protein LOC121377857 [Gigantopelta aegis]
MVRLCVLKVRTVVYVFLLLMLNFLFLYSWWGNFDMRYYVKDEVVVTCPSIYEVSGRFPRHLANQKRPQRISDTKYNNSSFVREELHVINEKRQRYDTTDDYHYPFTIQNMRLPNVTLKNKVKVFRDTRAFYEKMTQRDTRILKLILKSFVSTMENNRVVYFLYSGSLLGSFRHHGVIPWDDDVDIVVPLLQRQTLYKLLSDLKPSFFLDIKQKRRWKFYSVLSRPIRDHTWSWPFVDISFYVENQTHIWDSDVKFKNSFVYKKSDVFPLRKRPFMDMMLPAPRDPMATLKVNYDMDVCESSRYDHRLEGEIPRAFYKSLPCYFLHGKFSFVKHVALSDGWNETLEHNNHVLSWFFRRRENS